MVRKLCAVSSGTCHEGPKRHSDLSIPWPVLSSLSFNGARFLRRVVTAELRSFFRAKGNHPAKSQIDPRDYKVEGDVICTLVTLLGGLR